MMFYGVGEECGATLFGILFHEIGTRGTLIVSATVSGMLLVILLIYLRVSKHVHKYDKLPPDK